MTPPEQQGEESDQMPEEQPSGAVPEDTSESSRSETQGESGGTGDEGDSTSETATGEPKNA